MADERHLRIYEPDRPNAHLVSREGWRIGSAVGSYCLAWRDGIEVVLVWRDGEWQPISGAFRIAG